MKKKQLILLMSVVVVVIGIGAYAALSRYLGNNVEIESVMAAQVETATTEGAGEASETASTEVSSAELEGAWNIASGSKVYWSVTTSKETVNFVNEAVTGAWTVNLNDTAAMTGEGVLDMTALDSGNSQRDGHVKDRADLLEVSTYPQAKFNTQSFSSLPAEWKEGTAVPLATTGILTVKGKEKEVTFDGEAMYRGGNLLLSGTTKVTFDDFGMTSPHTVLLDTENELTVQLELVLNKA